MDPVLIFLSQEVGDGVGFLPESPVKVPMPDAAKLFLER